MGDSQPNTGLTHELPPNSTSAGTARRLVRAALVGFGEPLIEIAELLVSELVTNAVAHARCAPVMHIEISGQDVCVTVHDGSPGPVEVKDAAQDAPGGRGLLLVDSLAASWGWNPTPDGKRVWFTL